MNKDVDEVIILLHQIISIELCQLIFLSDLNHINCNSLWLFLNVVIH